ncbi:MAG: M28 family metallopeptidase, partial [Acidimicrobiales bacterium]
TTDFDGLDWSGPADIALVQRGACFFSTKAVNAEAAGAEAIIIFNQGTPGREGPVSGNAAGLPDGSPSNIGIPMVGAAFNAGVALSADGSTARVAIAPPVETTQYNVIAELAGKNDDNVVMAGAHLDSVPRGPGVQDNGSGSAAILETAVQMAKVRPENTVRFAWWGAEESGLVGSTAYVNSLSQEELDRIALYLNFDMIGSPNFVYFIYDGDDSDGVGAGPGPEGSAQIESFFEDFYGARSLPYLGTDFSGRSDYGPFIAVGIPAGGLFTGAEGIKTEEQASTWGGTAGDQYDPCYHLACDTFDNVSLEALDVNSDAVAASVLSFGMNTEVVNGVKGKGNFRVQNQSFGENS